MRISDWSSDVCSSDLGIENEPDAGMFGAAHDLPGIAVVVDVSPPGKRLVADAQAAPRRALAQPVKGGGGSVAASDHVSVVHGKRVEVRVCPGGTHIIK